MCYQVSLRKANLRYLKAKKWVLRTYLLIFVESYRDLKISNTIKENPEVWKVNSSLVFAVNHKCYSFLESSEPYLGGSGAGFPVFRFISVQNPFFGAMK